MTDHRLLTSLEDVETCLDADAITERLWITSTVPLEPWHVQAIEDRRNALIRTNKSRPRWGAGNNLGKGSCQAEWNFVRRYSGIWFALAPSAKDARGRPDAYIPCRGRWIGIEVKCYKGHDALQEDAHDDVARAYVDMLGDVQGWVDAGWRSSVQGHARPFREVFGFGRYNPVWSAKEQGLLKEEL